MGCHLECKQAYDLPNSLEIRHPKVPKGPYGIPAFLSRSHTAAAQPWDDGWVAILNVSKR